MRVNESSMRVNPRHHVLLSLSPSNIRALGGLLSRPSPGSRYLAARTLTTPSNQYTARRRYGERCHLYIIIVFTRLDVWSSDCITLCRQAPTPVLHSLTRLPVHQQTASKHHALTLSIQAPRTNEQLSCTMYHPTNSIQATLYQRPHACFEPTPPIQPLTLGGSRRLCCDASRRSPQ